MYSNLWNKGIHETRQKSKRTELSTIDLDHEGVWSIMLWFNRDFEDGAVMLRPTTADRMQMLHPAVRGYRALSTPNYLSTPFQ